MKTNKPILQEHYTVQFWVTWITWETIINVESYWKLLARWLSPQDASSRSALALFLVSLAPLRTCILYGQLKIYCILYAQPCLSKNARTDSFMARFGTNWDGKSGSRVIGSKLPTFCRCSRITARSYVSPLGVITGSRKISRVILQHK